MPQRRLARLPLAVLVLVLLGVAAFLLGRPPSPQEPPLRGDDARPPAGKERDRPPEPPLLRPREHPASSEAVPSAETSSPPPAEGRAPDVVAPGWVRFHIEGSADFEARPVALRIDVVCRPPLDRPRGTWHKGGATVVDVPLENWLTLPGLAELRVRVVHPDCLDEVLVVPRDALDEVIEVRMRPAVVAVGRLLQEDGTAFFGASAALHAVGPDAPMHDARRQWIATHEAAAWAEPNGRIRLKIAAPGEYLLVAGKHGHVPIGRMVTLGVEETTDLGDIVIPEGVRVSGHFTVQGRPAAGARLQASAQMAGTTFGSSCGRVVWDGARRFMPAMVETKTDAEGRFAFTGLAPGEYDVDLVEFRRGILAYSGALAPLGAVVAPASDAALALRGCEVHFRTRRSGEPVPDTNLLLDAGWANGRLDSARLVTNKRGEGTVLLLPHTTYRVHAVTTTGAIVQTEVKTGDLDTLDTVVIDLGPAPEPEGGTLVLVLQSETGSPIEAAYLDCTSESDGIGVAMGHPYSPAGRFELVLPQAGRWALRILPGTAEDRPWTTDYLPLETQVDVPAGGKVQTTLVARPGGRLQIELRDESGAYVPATVVVHGDHAEAAALTWEIQGTTATTRNARRLTGDGPAIASEVLPPGTYDIELSPEAGEPIRRRVALTARETTIVRVTLPAR